MYKKKTRNIVKSVLYSLIALIQISLVITAFVLEKLTAKKAGVMRHIYSRRLQFEQGIFSHNNLKMQSIAIITLSILFTVLLIFAIRKRSSNFHRIQLAKGLMLSILTVIVINSNIFIDMLAYPYFIIVFELVLMIQIIIILILQFNINRY